MRGSNQGSGVSLVMLSGSGLDFFVCQIFPVSALVMDLEYTVYSAGAVMYVLQYICTEDNLVTGTDSCRT